MSRSRRMTAYAAAAALALSAVSMVTAGSATATAEVPGAPTGLVVTQISDVTVEVTWTAPVSDGGSEITDYTIEYRQIGTDGWVWVPHEPADVLAEHKVTWEFSAEDPTSYIFHVAAVNGEGTGPWNVSVAAMDAGDAHACAVLVDGSVSCWGRNSSGQLGDGSTAKRSTPVAVIGLDGQDSSRAAVTVSAGGSHSCAVLVSGPAMCWGANSKGQAGNGVANATLVMTPVAVEGLDGSTPATTVVSIAAGGRHTCALLKTGAVTCWGDNESGQLGDSTNDNSATPVDVTGIDGSAWGYTAVAITAGDDHTCAAIADGKVMCWGAGELGQLGNNDTVPSNTPVYVEMLNGINDGDPGGIVMSVAAGADFTCVSTFNFGAKCWGHNDHGQLGAEEGSDMSTPMDVEGISEGDPATMAMSVTAGGSHACALVAAGGVTCWGDDASGQLGDESIAGASADSTAVAVSSGDAFTCSVMAPGSVSCWGEDATGQLGDGKDADRSTPGQVSGLTGAGASSSVRVCDTVRTSDPLVGAPKNIQLTSLTHAAVGLSWRAPTLATGVTVTDYVIDYRPDGSGSWSTFNDGVSKNATATVTGLSARSAYVFRVSAVSAGATGKGNIFGPVTTRMAPPTGVVASNATKVSLYVAWSVPTGSPVADYRIQYQRVGVNDVTWYDVAQRTVARGITATGLTANSAYRFRVAVKEEGSTDFGEWSTPSAKAYTKFLAKPSQPTDPQITAVTSKSVTLEWTASSSPDVPVSYYQVSRQQKGKNTWQAGTREWTDTMATSPGLTPGESYRFRVRAVSESSLGTFEGDWSALTPFVLAAEPPKGPAYLEAAVTGKTYVKVTWPPIKLRAFEKTATYTLKICYSVGPCKDLGTFTTPSVTVRGDKVFSTSIAPRFGEKATLTVTVETEAGEGKTSTSDTFRFGKGQ